MKVLLSFGMSHKELQTLQKAVLLFLYYNFHYRFSEVVDVQQSLKVLCPKLAICYERTLTK